MKLIWPFLFLIFAPGIAAVFDIVRIHMFNVHLRNCKTKGTVISGLTAWADLRIIYKGVL